MKLPALSGCGAPFGGWLTTTVWLSQRRRETNFFSCRQQLRRVQAKLHSSLTLVLASFFSSLPSSFFPPSSTRCSLVRVLSVSEMPAGAGVRFNVRRVPAVIYPPSGQWLPPFVINPTLWANRLLAKGLQRPTGWQQAGGAKSTRKKNNWAWKRREEGRREGRRERLPIKLCLMREVCAC